MAAPILFFDIAGPDLARQSAFYAALFGWEIGADGGFAVPVQSPLPATLRVEEAIHAERVLYVGVPDVTAALERVVALGGSVAFPRLEVPGVAVLGLFADPAGNRMGLIEMEGDSTKVPPPAPRMSGGG